MKITKTLQGALLALTGLALLAPQAKAVINVYHDGDILLGFRQVGATQDFLIDIGSFSSLPSVGSTTFSLGNVGADMVAAGFGASWYTSNTVQFSAFGDLSTGNGKIFIGNNVNASKSSALSGFLGNADSNISQVYGVYNSTVANGSSTTGLLQSTAAINSYASWQPGGANAGGINFAAWNGTESLVNANNYLDVYTLNANGDAPSGAPVAGYFSLASNGDISYTAAVPEPSTFAALAAGALILVSSRRRTRTA